MDREEVIDLWLDAEEELRNDNDDKAIELKEKFAVEFDKLDSDSKEYVKDYLDSVGA